MRNSLLLCCLLLAGSLYSQVIKRFDMVMRMDGLHMLESGHVTNIWGFAFNDLETGPQELRLPSPTLRVQEGDSVIVRVINPSQEGHTIHWHGLDVDQANDGVPMHSQFVLVGDTYTYRFRATHAGNYIYHCHVMTTLHLVMGMYGSFIVEHPDQRVFAGGPRYHRDYDYLGSELDQSWNDDDTQTGGLHTFSADQFLLNGKSGRQILEDPAMQVELNPGDTVLLRLINIGFDIHQYHFPANVQKLIVASDGRPLPHVYSSDTLSLYPGERYSVLLSTEFADSAAHIAVHYRSMIDRDEKGRNYIPINTNQPPAKEPEEDECEELNILPNPAQEQFYIYGATDLRNWEVFDQYGRLIARGETTEIPCSHWAKGCYTALIRYGSQRVMRKICTF